MNGSCKYSLMTKLQISETASECNYFHNSHSSTYLIIITSKRQHFIDVRNTKQHH
jgi:hypothetical protein